MKIQTSLTRVEADGTEVIRGHRLSDLVSSKSFVESIFLLLKGTLPKKNEARMLDAILTSVIDHGPATASALCARISASAKNPLHSSVAAGLLGLGDRHGVVVEAAMQFFLEHKNISDLSGLFSSMKEQKKYVPGLGHKIFEVDPRTEMLFALAREHNVFGSYCEFALLVQETMASLTSKKLPLNVDGAIAAILCDMNFDPRVGNGIFVIARIPGLVAQVVEEVQNDQGIRRLDPEDITYREE